MKKLHLPQTSFSLRPDKTKETYFAHLASNPEYYRQARAQRQGKPSWRLMDGPPYANGDCHLGHALNRFLKDAFLRTALMQGQDAVFQPGWDCHGLPLELLVEKKHGKQPLEQMKTFAKEAAMDGVSLQRNTLQRLGLYGEWDKPYLTLSPDYQAAQLQVVKTLFDKGALYAGKLPVHTCPACGSSLAEGELEHVESMRTEATFLAQAEGGQFAVWTTTPWTLSANAAYALNERLDYVLMKDGERTYYHLDNERALGEMLWRGTGKELLTKLGQAKKPFDVGTSVPVVHADFVTRDGTGFVHLAPAHGREDHMAATQYGFSWECHRAKNGTFTAGPFVGLKEKHATNVACEMLAAQGSLLYHREVQHNATQCWRHHLPTFQLASPQVFLKVEGKVRARMLEMLEKVDLTLADKTAFLNTLKGRGDWCLSRQRQWGVPLRVWRKDDGLLPQSSEVLSWLAKEAEGVSDGSERVALETQLSAMGAEPCTDVMDVWFDSGCASMASGNHTPNLVLEGLDQYRGWFGSLLLVHAALETDLPYRAVATHRFVVDARKEKLSKSLGNAEKLDWLTQEYGADTLRLWALSGKLHKENVFSKERVREMGETYKRFRLTLRFLLSNLHERENATDNPLDVDVWVVEEARREMKRVGNLCSSGAFPEAVEALYEFCDKMLSSFYFGLAKDRLYVGTAKERASAQWACEALFRLLCHSLQPLAPVLVEEVWMVYSGQEGYLLARQSDRPTTWQSKLPWLKLRVLREWVLGQVESAQQSGTVGSLANTDLTLALLKDELSMLSMLGKEQRFLFGAAALVVQEGTQRSVTAARSKEDACPLCRYSAPMGTAGACVHCKSDEARMML